MEEDTNQNIEKYKCIKTSLHSIMKDNVDEDFYTNFFDCLNRANQISYIIPMFIRDYIINGHYIGDDIVLDEKFISKAFSALCRGKLKIDKNGKEFEAKRGGRPIKEENLGLFNSMKTFYDESFSNFFPNTDINNKIEGTNISEIYNDISIEISTSYKNHIRFNWSKMISHYVNEIYVDNNFIFMTKAKLSELSKSEKFNYKNMKDKYFANLKLMKKELIKVKLDILENTLTSNPKFHTFIKSIKETFPILPITIQKYTDYVDIEPFKFLRGLLTLNKKLEDLNKKLFQPIPIRTSVGNRYIPIDTSTLKDIFGKHKNLFIKSKVSVSQNFTDKLPETVDTNDTVWDSIFNIDKKIYKLTNYSFNHLIHTDGKIVSIIFIHNLQVPKKEQKNINLVEGRKKAAKNYKEKSVEEIQKIKIEKELKEIKIKEDRKVAQEKKRKENKTKFKNLSKEHQQKIKDDIKTEKFGFSYIENFVKNPDNLEELKNDSLIFCDPGMRDLLTLYGKGQKMEKKKRGRTEIVKGLPTENVLYSYRTKRSLRETNRLESNEKLDKIKKTTKIGNYDKTIKDFEADLSNYNSKSMDPNCFGEFIKLKIKLFYDLQEEKNYLNKLSQQRWYAYINTKRHEAKILNEVVKIYGENSRIIMGDWSKGACIKYISTPNTKMLRLLSTRFKKINMIDEFNTSKLYHFDDNIESKKFKRKVRYRNKKGEEIAYDKELHAVLTFKMGSRMDCINRDRNAVLNMKKIVNFLLENQVRPNNFDRSYVALQQSLKKNSSTSSEEVKTIICEDDNESVSRTFLTNSKTTCHLKE